MGRDLVVSILFLFSLCPGLPTAYESRSYPRMFCVDTRLLAPNTKLLLTLHLFVFSSYPSTHHTIFACFHPDTTNHASSSIYSRIVKNPILINIFSYNQGFYHHQYILVSSRIVLSSIYSRVKNPILIIYSRIIKNSILINRMGKRKTTQGTQDAVDATLVHSDDDRVTRAVRKRRRTQHITGASDKQKNKAINLATGAKQYSWMNPVSSHSHHSLYYVYELHREIPTSMINITNWFIRKTTHPPPRWEGRRATG